MVVKSQQAGDHIQHLSDTFQILHKFNMKLNPEKCAFGVSSGKFLGFFVSNRGIEVDLLQIKAIEEIPDTLISKKEVQRLTGRISALGRFISKSSEKCFRFFSALKKQDQFEWSEECQQALKNLKVYLSNPSLLAKPKDGEKLLIYLAVSEEAVLADFVVDFSQGIQLEAEKELQVLNESNPGTWTLFTNGSSNVKGAGLGLELARDLGIEQFIIKSDSQLVVNQMLGTYTTREARIEENAEADALANLASAAEATNDEDASVIHLFHSVLDQDKNKYGILPDDKKKAQALCKKAARYCLKQSNLNRKMFGGPLARCLGPSQTEYVMREIHEGHCGNHAGGRSLVKTMIRAGYYWPKMEADAENFVAKYDKCQRYGNNMHRPAKLLHPKRLKESKGNWPEVLPGVLWAYRTTTKTSMEKTPFSLVYGAEALIPVDIGEPSTRYTQATEESMKKRCE
uniref:Integrase zinc-binding domain-containing protein n=1 Tax=Nicotiana tabacum TaxID=4097 RepID=A0A1S4B6S5_TOBAC|nr:PREDICTED: uncharacterized protein LOC107805081 [Nicotiana tabacum]